ncbi:MAG: sensor histidine kinase [Solibacillus sp.]
MIRLFLREHIAWLLFIFGMQLFVNVLFYVDSGVETVSIRYFNIVWLTFVILFLVVRYFVEAKRMKRYEQLQRDYIETVKYDAELQIKSLQMQQQEGNLTMLEQQDELLAWVHEMKAPLTAMRLLIDHVECAERKERLENEWLRLYLLLDQQLHASRLMTIEQDNRLEKVLLKEVVITEVKALRSWCFERELEVELENLTKEVVTDAKWLGFIVRQVLSNAVKYSKAGGQITIYTADNVLCIQDDGIGIAAEDLPRIFRKSYTGTVGRETSTATGMGLYLAKQAADSLNITLGIQSEKNKGTTVKLQFPQQNDYMKTLGM